MKQTLIMFLIGIVACFSLAMIITSFDPFKAPGYVKFLFFTSLFVMIWCIGTVMIYSLSGLGEEEFENAFRRGLWASLVICTSVFMARLFL